MIQINIDMPRDCEVCPCRGIDYLEHPICNITGFEVYIYRRDRHCPLQEVEDDTDDRR